MKNIALIIFLSISATFLMAQPLNVSTPDAMTKAAEQAIEEGNPYAAWEFYIKVYKETKDKQVRAKIAELDYELRDYTKASRTLGRLVTRDRKKLFTEYKYYYAMSLKAEGNYQEAMDMFDDYALQGADEAKVARCKLEVEGCKLAKKSKAAPNLIVTHIEKPLNTKQSEGSPTVSEGTLYYASLNSKEIIELDEAKDWGAKIYAAAPNGTGGFGAPTALGQEINREGYHQGNVHVTKDGKVMYFTRVLMESHRMTESKIFYARNNGGEWGAANEVSGVNGEYLAKHPCIGELFGEKVMFFIAEIPGGEGGDDIYYATRKEDGLFGAPVNLGPSINTPSNEATPFYNNGKLFFSSDGYASLGGLDVYSSTWNGSNWSAVENMGAGINSPVDDFFFIANEDEKSGHLVSNREGSYFLKSKYCCDDVWAWELEQVKVNLSALTYRFKSKKKREKENQPLPNCTLELFDVTDKSPNKTESRTNPTGNDFAFSLLPEKEYMLIATREGYRTDTIVLNTVGVKKSKNLSKKITLRRERKKPVPPVEPAAPDSIVLTLNEPIRMNNIYYDYDDDKILEASEQDLYVILDLMNQYSDMVIELSSHTDSRGKVAYNQNLSQRRAESARRWLIDKGVQGERIKPVGYGESVILNQCLEGVTCSDEEHRYNRRTEFKIIAGPTTITIKKMEVNPSGKGAGGKQSWNSFIYDLLEAIRQDTVKPSALESIFESNDAAPAPSASVQQVEEVIEMDVAPAVRAVEAAEAMHAVEVMEAKKKPELIHAKEVLEAKAPVLIDHDIVDETPVDTWKNPADDVMVFKAKSHHFGAIEEGEKVEKLFLFENTGEEALVMDVVSACDCIQLDYTRTLIEKGQTGNVSITFDSNGQKGKVEKTIDIIFGNSDADGYPLIQQLKLVGDVK